MTDMVPFRKLLQDFEIKVQEVNQQVCEKEILGRTRDIKGELQTGLRHSLTQYSTLKYVTEEDPDIAKLPPEVRETERRTMNEPVRVVIKGLVYCRNHPRVTANDLKKLKNTTFKGWPSHLDIEVLPDLIRFGHAFYRLVQAQSDLEADPLPVRDSLATLPEAPAAGDPPEETAIAE